jgi:beta-1,4-mannooligosaccharide/beta-1,4-mannosyl-N-acetylglucosamine phosphorylase
MAVDTVHGIRGGIFKTDDFQSFELISLTLPDNRNMVLFPEKLVGHFVRLERPFPIYMREQDESFDLWISRSPDLRFWGDTRLLLAASEVPFCNAKIGPGAPPVKTPQGWLTTFHTVEKHPEKTNRGWEDQGWFKTYYGGIMLLDLENPSKLLGFSRKPLLAPEAEYELDGFRGGVIFPTGMILEDTGEVKIYYGASDTVVALASAHVDDLVARCLS